MKNFLIILCIAVFAFLSCTEEQMPPDTEPIFNFQPGEGYFLLNEGGFAKGNASVSYRHYDSDSIVNHVYETVNEQALGDVLQNAVIHDESMYLVVNNSGYIKEVDLTTFEETGEISGLVSPRQMHIINDEKAYVSNYFSSNLSIVDLNTLTITDSIELDGWTEEMVQVDNRIFVTSPSSYGGPASTAVFVIDVESDALVETINIGVNPSNILADENGWIHVFCQGDPFGDPIVKPSVYSINSFNLSEIRMKNIPNLPVAYQSKMAFSPDQETIYLLYGSIYEIDVLENGLALTSFPLIDSEGRSLYGIAVYPSSGNLFITDAKDYNSNGTVYEYKTNAIEVDQFDAGIIPSGIVWY